MFMSMSEVLAQTLDPSVLQKLFKASFLHISIDGLLCSHTFLVCIYRITVFPASFGARRLSAKASASPLSMLTQEFFAGGSCKKDANLASTGNQKHDQSL